MYNMRRYTTYMYIHVKYLLNRRQIRRKKYYLYFHDKEETHARAKRKSDRSVCDGGCCEVDNCVVGVVGGKTYF